MSTMAPGWYPYHDGRRRYWDGTQWDGDFAPGWRTELASGGRASSAGAGVRVSGDAHGLVAVDAGPKPVARVDLPGVATTGARAPRDASESRRVGRDAPAGRRVPRELPVDADERPWFRRKRFVIPGAAVGLVVAVAVAGSVIGGAGREPAGTAAVIAPSATQATAPAGADTRAADAPAAQAGGQDAATLASAQAPKAVSFPGDGTFEVGADIDPGLYRSSGMGYWERLEDATGGLDAILANEKTSGQAYVQIQEKDGWFSTRGMEDWVLVTGAAAGPRATTFGGDGMYQVGVDIEPGTYTSAGDGYWERLKSAVGGVDGIITNGNPEGKATVKIAKTDKFFSTVGMGEWTRVK